jgi:hypothetical protein
VHRADASAYAAAILVAAGVHPQLCQQNGICYLQHDLQFRQQFFLGSS